MRTNLDHFESKKQITLQRKALKLIKEQELIWKIFESKKQIITDRVAEVNKKKEQDENILGLKNK